VDLFTLPLFFWYIFFTVLYLENCAYGGARIGWKSMLTLN